ncbi:hypothetical protein Poly24_35120 [Rosistilla carotiformis]|uniref:DUF5658 domain-containing protein n=1 Tax=Rosistilla carotiformis TaxID=2528017 RepID=A0A518JW74_9BACT|nr:hypothetical protein [Rosistilla carotiformis]QDV69795.1 hypothetical protein Poly24_35120 [Rosistilla carotiformis]
MILRTVILCSAILSVPFSALAETNLEMSVASRRPSDTARDTFRERGGRIEQESRVNRLEEGYLFVDGERVACPLEITSIPNSEFLSANGYKIWVGTRQTSRNRGRDDDSSRQFRNNRFHERYVVDSLLANRAVFAFSDSPAVILNEIVFCGNLLKFDRESDLYRDLQEAVTDKERFKTIDTWFASYKPSQDLIDAATAVVERYEQAEQINRAQVSAATALNQLTYPMTMFGLIVGVYAFGHLMMTTPKTPALFPEANLLDLMSRATVVSVALICAHASLDLAWTLLTSQAGQMREINPVGAQFVDSPVALITFKAIATLTACGLLIGLRKHRFAQTACWWMCLVCTILTFRWLIFSSMLV